MRLVDRPVGTLRGGTGTQTCGSQSPARRLLLATEILDIFAVVLTFAGVSRVQPGRETPGPTVSSCPWSGLSSPSWPPASTAITALAWLLDSWCLAIGCWA